VTKLYIPSTLNTTHCRNLDIYISRKIRLCDLEGKVQTNLQAKSMTFLLWKFISTLQTQTPLQTQTLYSSQGTPCEPISTRKNLFSLQGTPVLIAGSLVSLQGFPCKPLYFPVRDCSVLSQTTDAQRGNSLHCMAESIF